MIDEIIWDISALHFISKNINKAMLQFGEFIGNCDTLPWNTYGIHIYEYENNLIFIG